MAEEAEEFDDVGVVELDVGLELLLDVDLIERKQFGEVDAFDGVVAVGGDVAGEVDDGEAAVAQLLLQDEIRQRPEAMKRADRKFQFFISHDYLAFLNPVQILNQFMFWFYKEVFNLYLI